MLYTAFLECRTPRCAVEIKDRHFRGTETHGLRIIRYVLRDRFMWVTIRGTYRRIYNTLMDLAYELEGEMAFIGLLTDHTTSDICNLHIIEDARYWRTGLCEERERALIANFINLPRLPIDQFEEIVGACCLGNDHYDGKESTIRAYEFWPDDVHPWAYWETKITSCYSFDTERLFVKDGYDTLARVMAHCYYLSQRETLGERIFNFVKNMLGGEKRAAVL